MAEEAKAFEVSRGLYHALTKVETLQERCLPMLPPRTSLFSRVERDTLSVYRPFSARLVPLGDEILTFFQTGKPFWSWRR